MNNNNNNNNNGIPPPSNNGSQSNLTPSQQSVFSVLGNIGTPGFSMSQLPLQILQNLTPVQYQMIQQKHQQLLMQRQNMFQQQQSNVSAPASVATPINDIKTNAQQSPRASTGGAQQSTSWIGNRTTPVSTMSNDVPQQQQQPFSITTPSVNDNNNNILISNLPPNLQAQLGQLPPHLQQQVIETLRQKQLQQQKQQQEQLNVGNATLKNNQYIEPHSSNLATSGNFVSDNNSALSTKNNKSSNKNNKNKNKNNKNAKNNYQNTLPQKHNIVTNAAAIKKTKIKNPASNNVIPNAFVPTNNVESVLSQPPKKSKAKQQSQAGNYMDIDMKALRAKLPKLAPLPKYQVVTQDPPEIHLPDSSSFWSSKLKSGLDEEPNTDLLLYEQIVRRDKDNMLQMIKERDGIQPMSKYGSSNKEYINRLANDLNYYKNLKDSRIKCITNSNANIPTKSIWGDGFQGYGNGISNTITNIIPGDSFKIRNRKILYDDINKVHQQAMSEFREQLVPIRLEFDAERDKLQLRDTFLINKYDGITSLKELIDETLDDYRFRPNEYYSTMLLNSIKEQIQEFQEDPFLIDPRVGGDDLRIRIKLDIIVGQAELIDAFEWDISNPDNNPEEFAIEMCKELKLPNEFVTEISHSIREQVQMYHKALFLTGYKFNGNVVEDDEIRSRLQPFVTLDSVLRPVNDIKIFTPNLLQITAAELDRLDKDKDRDTRRKRRQGGRSKRSGMEILSNNIDNATAANSMGNNTHDAQLLVGNKIKVNDNDDVYQITAASIPSFMPINIFFNPTDTNMTRNGNLSNEHEDSISTPTSNNINLNNEILDNIENIDGLMPDLGEIPKTFRTPFPSTILPGGYDLGPNVLSYKSFFEEVVKQRPDSKCKIISSTDDELIIRIKLSSEILCKMNTVVKYPMLDTPLVGNCMKSSEENSRSNSTINNSSKIENKPMEEDGDANSVLVSTSCDTTTHELVSNPGNITIKKPDSSNTSVVGQDVSQMDNMGTQNTDTNGIVEDMSSTVSFSASH
ncbi:uncharacterized protein SCODWIG_03062 [Saccharomycodes ludwigii]|uniref:SWI/SNF chromatin-remodeling complex subunit SNF5 n=1 Tax=Saccharomycodes ludwigii TaxID=36035 RepID=A0A376B9K3_9ASCO|nr:hypothetical protein SCDLUD_003121 [Saccharomycodes ludwigii]KAH3900151.1 hypothetical protein SCDLUD_003121 [Saccharomycodes ludwigii]SSD61301.1 uncharacterized protein SCODWIG_03062 [Saccharomycodes ludwigii]